VRFPMRMITGSAQLDDDARNAPWLAELIRAVAAVKRPGAIYLDFCGIQATSRGFLWEVVLGLRRYCRKKRPDLQLIVANANARIRLELSCALADQRDAMMICKLDGHGDGCEPNVIGQLSAREASVLRTVLRVGVACARCVENDQRHFNMITPANWRQALLSLSAKGILVASGRGKSARFRPSVR
jgi:hypothetical protein